MFIIIIVLNFIEIEMTNLLMTASNIATFYSGRQSNRIVAESFARGFKQSIAQTENWKYIQTEVIRIHILTVLRGRNQLVLSISTTTAPRSLPNIRAAGVQQCEKNNFRFY